MIKNSLGKTGGENSYCNSLIVDTNTLKVDSINNRVGICTANPVAQLEVAGTIIAQILRLGNLFNLTTAQFISGIIAAGATWNIILPFATQGIYFFTSDTAGAGYLCHSAIGGFFRAFDSADGQLTTNLSTGYPTAPSLVYTAASRNVAITAPGTQGWNNAQFNIVYMQGL